MADLIDDLKEQITAAKDVVHLHTCYYCRMATATEILVVIQDLPPEGCRVLVLGTCDLCKDDGENVV